MPCSTRLVHIPALDLTARVRRDLTPACIARALAELRADIDAVKRATDTTSPRDT